MANSLSDAFRSFASNLKAKIDRDFQKKTDDTLTTASKEIVGAINSIDGEMIIAERMSGEDIKCNL